MRVKEFKEELLLNKRSLGMHQGHMTHDSQGVEVSVVRVRFGKGGEGLPL